MTLILASVSAQAAPPTVSTGAAINVTKTSATLTGYLDPSTITAYYFEYGTSTGYSQQTLPQPAPAGTGVMLVQADVSGLAANTTYHFQLVVVVGAPPYAQTFGGGDQSFRTASSTGGGGGPTPSGGTLRLVGRTLSVHRGKVSVSLWCASSRACQGSLWITAGRRSCVSGRGFALGAGAAKTLKATVSGACRARLRKAAKHRAGGRLTAILSSGQPTLSSAVTLVRH